ncbi:MAG: lipase family protein, partial [Pirellulaceae bacterium]
MGRAWVVPRNTVYTVGYPGPPRQFLYPPTLLEQLFQSTYGCKRLAPGELVTPQSPLFNWTLAHDATTLGGNSGSVVLVLGDEMVAAGLHYGGKPQLGTTLGENWGHVLGSVLDETDGFHPKTLRETLKERGVELMKGDVSNGQPEGLAKKTAPGANPHPSGNAPAISRLAIDARTDSPAAVIPAPNATPSAASLSSAGAVTFTVPLQITITLGSPQPSAAPGAARVTEGLLGQSQPLAEVAARFHLDSLNETDFHWQTALSLALASKLAYSPLALVQTTGLSDWRLATCVYLEEAETECFVASTPDAVFVAFRGTAGLGDWIADLNVRSVRRTYGTIHRGFHFAYQDIRPQVEQALATLGNRRLLLTGHSLGAALATIAACELPERYRVTGIYAFGQPRIGFQDFR